MESQQLLEEDVQPKNTRPTLSTTLPTPTTMSEQPSLTRSPEEVLAIAKNFIAKGEIHELSWRVCELNKDKVSGAFKCVDGRDSRLLCAGPGGAMGIVIALAKAFWHTKLPNGEPMNVGFIKEIFEKEMGPITGHTDHHAEARAKEEEGVLCYSGCGHCNGSVSLAEYELPADLQEQLKQAHVELNAENFVSLEGEHEELGLIIVKDDISDDEALVLSGFDGQHQFFVFNAMQYYEAVAVMARTIAQAIGADPVLMATLAVKTSETLDGVTVKRLNKNKVTNMPNPVIVVTQIASPDMAKGDLIEFSGSKAPAYYDVVLAS